MSRRRLVALVSALLMLGLAAGAVSAFVAATQSEGGREWIRRVAEAQLSRIVNGRVALGTLSGSFLTDLRVDSVRIADREDSVFVATGPVRVTFDPRDLIDGRIILRTVDVQRPFVAVRQHLDGEWTHDRLFPRSVGRRVLRRRSGFGAVFLVEQARVREGEFALLLPWAPDSAPSQRITRAWRWREIALDLPRARFAYPDSTGMHFDIARLDVVEEDPPFTITGLTGEVLLGRDTLWVDVPRLSLPGSLASGAGRVSWGGGQPARYDFRVEADSVALADVAWIDPAIPTEGGGRMRLAIRSAADNPRAIEYAITQMDVRTHRSRLVGAMTWGVADRDVSLRDVDLEFAPLDAELLERFNRGPLGIPLRGQLSGRLRARGGPLRDFVVDDADISFRDGNVPGATARGRASGRLDISTPASPVFHGLAVDVAQFDLRTARAWEPSFPALQGTLRGTAVLDSAWGDVRLSDADITHADGDAPESRLRGTARLSWNDGPLRWDLDAAALPISVGTLARSFPAIPVRGSFDGPLRSSGTADAMTIAGDLIGPAGRVETDLRLSPGQPGFRLLGRANLSVLDLRQLLDDPAAPVTELNGRVNVDLAGDSLAALIGAAQLDLDRSLVSGARIFTGTTQLRFGAGRVLLDTLYLESSAVDLAGRGALGLTAAGSDSLFLRARMDSLGGLRPWLARPPGDSLSGTALVDLRAYGWYRDLAVAATGTGGQLRYAGITADVLRATADLRGLPQAPSGRVLAFGDTLGLGALALREAQLGIAFSDTTQAALTFLARGRAGTALRAAGQVQALADSTFIRVDTVVLNTAASGWRLGRPANIVVAGGGFRVDSLPLRTDSSLLWLAGAYPARAPLDLRLQADNLPLSDVAELLQLDGADEGRIDLRAGLSGTRAEPRLELDGRLQDSYLRGLRLDTLRVQALAVADQVNVNVTLGPDARPALRADGRLPLRLGLDGSGTGMQDDGALRASVTADSLGLELFEALTRGSTGARGTMQVALQVGGTWARPTFDGNLRVVDGALAPPQLGLVQWRNVQADIAFRGDSIALRTLSARSNGARSGRAAVTGWVSLADRGNPALDLSLTAREFNAYARPNVADVDVSGDLRLSGRWEAARLTGALTADRAIIAIPELASKDVISLEGPDRFGVIDTVTLVDTRAAASAPPAFIENLTVANVPIRMGRDVWIRSEEANINLGGELNVTRGRIQRGPNAGQLQLAVDGPLQTVRGTYRLNLGLVQRTFEVEQGEIRFFGEPELNPTLDISALHTVRQYSEQGVRPDVRVRVHLGGTLQQPTAELSTPDSLRVTNADLISYLVTGGPSFEIGGRNGDLSATAARVLLGSFGSVIGSKVAGGLCDDAQLSTAGLEGYGGRVRNVGGGILSGTRINCAKQVGDRAFVRLDAGLCQVGQLVSNGGGRDPLSFTDALGVKLDYLLGGGYTVSAGVEPPTSAVLCAVNANASARGFVPTPRQVGFDLYRAWRF